MASITRVADVDPRGIMIDAGVVSEITRARPETAVPAWLAGHTAHTLFPTAGSHAASPRGAANRAGGPARDRREGCGSASDDPRNAR